MRASYLPRSFELTPRSVHCPGRQVARAEKETLCQAARDRLARRADSLPGSRLDHRANRQALWLPPPDGGEVSPRPGGRASHFASLALAQGTPDLRHLALDPPAVHESESSDVPALRGAGRGRLVVVGSVPRFLRLGSPQRLPPGLEPPAHRAFPGLFARELSMGWSARTTARAEEPPPAQGFSRKDSRVRRDENGRGMGSGCALRRVRALAPSSATSWRRSGNRNHDPTSKGEARPAAAQGSQGRAFQAHQFRGRLGSCPPTSS